MPPATGPGGPFANPFYLVDQYGNPLATGNSTPADGVGNPSGLLPVESFPMAWNGSSWQRALNSSYNSDNNSASDVGQIVKADNFIFNGTGWDRQRSSGLGPGVPAVDDHIRALVVAGQAFTATSGILATATNANVYIAMGLLASNIAKNVLIYRITADAQNPTGDLHISQASSLDANLTAAITPLNNNLGSATTSLVTVKTTPASNTAPTSSSGTLRLQWGSAASLGNGVIDQITAATGSSIFIPAGATQGITVWIKIPTAANTGQINMEWVEF